MHDNKLYGVELRVGGRLRLFNQLDPHSSEPDLLNRPHQLALLAYSAYSVVVTLSGLCATCSRACDLHCCCLTRPPSVHVLVAINEPIG